MKLLAAFIPGALFAFAGSLFVRIAFAQEPSSATLYGSITFVLLWAIAAVFCYRAPNARAAWHQMFSGLGLALFLIPFVAVNSLDNGSGAITDQEHIRNGITAGAVGILCLFLAVLCAAVTLFLRPKKQANEQGC